MAKACILLGFMLVRLTIIPAAVFDRQQNGAVFTKHDEWYCKVDFDKFQICRKCKTLEENCDYEAPDYCICENMKFANNDCKLDLFNDFLISTYMV